MPCSTARSSHWRHVYQKMSVISARPPEIRSTVAKSSNTRTGSTVLTMVTALAKRIRSVTAAIAAKTAVVLCK